MNLVELEKRLLAVARANRPSEAVPYAFTKRIMAHVQALKPEDRWGWWGTALWRGALASVAVALLCGAWVISPLNTNRASNEPNQDLATSLLAAVDDLDNSW